MSPRGTNIIFVCFIVAVFVSGLLLLKNLREGYNKTLNTLSGDLRAIELRSPYLDSLQSIQRQLNQLERGIDEWENGTFDNNEKLAYLSIADTVLSRSYKLTDLFEDELYRDSLQSFSRVRLEVWSDMVLAVENFPSLYSLLKNPLTSWHTSLDSAEESTYFPFFVEKAGSTYLAKLDSIARQEEEKAQETPPKKKTAAKAEATSPPKTFTQKQVDSQVRRKARVLQKSYSEDRRELLALLGTRKDIQNAMEDLTDGVRMQIQQEKLGSQNGAGTDSDVEKISADAVKRLDEEFDRVHLFITILGSILLVVLVILGVNHTLNRRQIKSREDFVFKVSHEIKNALHPIIGYAATLGKTVRSPESRQMIWTINEESQNLLYLANGILDLSKINRSEFELEISPFFLKDALDQVISSHAIEAKEKGIELISRYDPNLPKAVKGDSVRLKQIIRNLLGNAIKHTAKGKVLVEVRLQKDRRKMATLEFMVKDSGKGMSREDIRKISRFKRKLVLGDNTQGHGLGLAISNQLVRQHKGKMKIRSKGLQKGVEVIFTIPYEVASIQEVPIPPELSDIVSHQLVGKRILIVDDDLVNLELSTMWLQSIGAEVETAPNGKAGQRHLKSNKVDLILADLQMPELDGVSFVQWLRGRRKDQTPVIICSAGSVGDISTKVKASGANDFLPKPYNQEELVKKISLYITPPNFPPLVSPPMKDPQTPNSHTAYAVQKLQQELNGNQKAVDKKIKLLIKVCTENMADIKQGVNKKDLSKVNRAVHKMLMICLYLGKEFVQQQADLEEATKKGKMSSNIRTMTLDFVTKVEHEVKKLEAYSNYSSLNN